MAGQTGFFNGIRMGRGCASFLNVPDFYHEVQIIF